MEYTKGERQVIDTTAGGLVFTGLLPYAVDTPTGRIARFVTQADAQLDAAAPAMYEALEGLSDYITSIKEIAKELDVVGERVLLMHIHSIEDIRDEALAQAGGGHSTIKP